MADFVLKIATVEMRVTYQDTSASDVVGYIDNGTVKALMASGDVVGYIETGHTLGEIEQKKE